MNYFNTTEVPDWVTEMADEIRNDNDSPAKDANVFYWNWVKEARSKSCWRCYLDDPSLLDLMQNSVLGVPFDMVQPSGENLAKAMAVALPSGYSGTTPNERKK